MFGSSLECAGLCNTSFAKQSMELWVQTYEYKRFTFDAVQRVSPVMIQTLQSKPWDMRRKLVQVLFFSYDYEKMDMYCDFQVFVHNIVYAAMRCCRDTVRKSP